MRRTARLNQHEDDYRISSNHNLLFNDSNETEEILQMNIVKARSNVSFNNIHRSVNTMEAKVETGDTLQALALRFHCTVADIKRLNKIDKENEIHARKVIKIPVTIHNVLLDNLPTVHKSGNNSPKAIQTSDDNENRNNNSALDCIARNPLEDANTMLTEKLLVASVNSSGLQPQSTSKASLAREADINNIILNSKSKFDFGSVFKDEGESPNDFEDISAPLITDILDESTNVPQLHRIRGPSLRAMDWSGSDCDMSWICLFVIILALCFVIPLVYVFYIAEHSHHNTTGLVAPLRH